MRLICRAAVPLLSWMLLVGTAHALPDIYSSPRDAEHELSAAIATATTTHRRVIVDFGGNWCPDCHVLDHFFHDENNLALLNAHFVLVHVNIGHGDENLSIAKRFKIPLSKGVPALAVLDEHGQLLYSQQDGEFEAMRSMDSAAVTGFLQRWTP